MKTLLKDPGLQAELDAKGYVQMPFLSQEELEELRAFYAELHPGGEPPEKIEGIHMTTWCSDFGYKMKVAGFLDTLYQRACDENFEQYRRLNNVFIVKESGKGTTFKVHQDWNVVDENENFAINVWVPLHDVDSSSGALWVLEGSHKINRHVRGSAYLFPDYSAFYPELEKAAKSVSLKAGHAIVFYLNIIHGSPPNLAEEPRKATCFSIIPKDAPLTIYFQKKAGDPLEIHSPPDDFMYRYTHLRTETFERPPDDQPVALMDSHINEPVRLEELSPYLDLQTTKSSRWWPFRISKR